MRRTGVCNSMCGVQWKAIANKSAWLSSKYQNKVKYLKQISARVLFAFWPPKAVPLDVGSSSGLAGNISK